MDRLFILTILPLLAVLQSACSTIDSVYFSPNSGCLPESANVVVTQTEARDIADMFLNYEAGRFDIETKSIDSGSKQVSSSTAVREDGNDLMFIFNYEGGGFVIVGSTRNYYPILAYSDKGSFMLQEDMGAVDVWFDETKVSIKNTMLSKETNAQIQQLWARYDSTYAKSAQELGSARRPQSRSTGEDACWERIETLQAEHGSEGWVFNSLSNAEYYFNEWGFGALYDQICYFAAQNHSNPSETVIGYMYPAQYVVGPLIRTLWYQGGIFGSLCSNQKAGCTAVAAGQVMYYHKFPVSMEWDGVTFTWSDTDIPAAPTSSSKHPQLMRMLGQKFQMTYATESWADDPNVKTGLDSLGYVDSLEMFNSTTHPFTPSTARDELILYRRPVIMGGYLSSDLNDPRGHTWVCEGARESFPYRLFFYTENQPYGAGSFTQGMYSYNNPGDVGNINSSVIYFYMNWGAGEEGTGYNGWYVSNDVSSYYGDYKYDRSNIYVRKP